MIKNSKTKIFFPFTIFFLLPQFVFAAPSISGISGTLTHGSAVTINGAGFGVKSTVAPLKWDPIDGMYGAITEGAVVPHDGAGNNWGDLSASSVDPATFTLLNPRGKFAAKYSNRTTLSSGGNGVVGHTNFPAAESGKLYISYWLNSNASTATLSTTSSFKFMRLTNDGGWGNGSAVTFIWEPDKFYDYDFSTGYHYEQWKGWTGNVNAWNRMEITIDNTANPKPKMTGYVNNQLFIDGISGDGTGTAGGSTTGALSSDITGIYTLGADWSNWGTSTAPRLDFGEIYVDNTLARVEICDASIKATSTHCEIQIPETTWNDGQLQIKVDQGSFTEGSSAYLYVIDANGSANANGFPITFGTGSSDAAAPAAPSELSVI